MSAAPQPYWLSMVIILNISYTVGCGHRGQQSPYPYQTRCGDQHWSHVSGSGRGPACSFEEWVSLHEPMGYCSVCGPGSAFCRPNVGSSWPRSRGWKRGLYVRVYYSISIEIVILSEVGLTLAGEVEGPAFRRRKPTLGRRKPTLE